VHPQSIVHSLVELSDGSLIAQMGVTDMRLPIQYAISYPERWNSPVPVVDLTRVGPLTFEEPDMAAFPCLGLAYRALDAERSLPIVLNAANEVAVAAFLQRVLRFHDIPDVIAAAMDAHTAASTATLDAVRAVDRWARQYAAELVASRRSGVASRGRIGSGAPPRD
jgi:1-deoxy-D-xylulose-5-phosphate reductoisomerase